MRDEYARATQRDRARQMDARMRQALADDESSKSGRKWLVLVIVALLVLGAVFTLTACPCGNKATKTEEAQSENPMDGSQAGANAVTVEDLKAREDYETDWQKIAGYELTWGVISESDGVTIADASDGPIYDLPVGWTSFTAHDKATNRAYTVIVSDVGTFNVIPMLDENGDQVITERY